MPEGSQIIDHYHYGRMIPAQSIILNHDCKVLKAHPSG
jgi:hypothetical protein